MLDNQLPGSPKERSGRVRDKKTDAPKPVEAEQSSPETGPAVNDTAVEDQTEEQRRARDKEDDGKTVANP